MSPSDLTPELRTTLTAVPPTPRGLGTPKLYLMEDPEILAQWVVVYGWLTDSTRNIGCKSLIGDVVYRGPVRSEVGPQMDRSNDYQYIIGLFKNRTCTEI